MSLSTTPNGVNAEWRYCFDFVEVAVGTELADKKDTTGFGARLRALRTAKEMTQERLGELAGMRYQEIARLERGDRTPSWQTVLRLAEALGVEPNDFTTSKSDE